MYLPSSDHQTLQTKNFNPIFASEEKASPTKTSQSPYEGLLCEMGWGWPQLWTIKHTQTVWMMDGLEHVCPLSLSWPRLSWSPEAAGSELVWRCKPVASGWSFAGLVAIVLECFSKLEVSTGVWGSGLWPPLFFTGLWSKGSGFGDFSQNFYDFFKPGNPGIIREYAGKTRENSWVGEASKKSQKFPDYYQIIPGFLGLVLKFLGYSWVFPVKHCFDLDGDYAWP